MKTKSIVTSFVVLPALNAFLCTFNKLSPYFLIAFESLPVSNDKQEMPCSSYGDIHPAIIGQKPQACFRLSQFIRSHAIYDNDIFLATLIGVHCIDLN